MTNPSKLSVSMTVLLAKEQPSGSLKMPSIRIVIVDDQEVARRGIRLVLAMNPEVKVIGEVANGEDAPKTIQDLHPDIVLLDISLPGISGIDVAAILHHSAPDSRIIFVSQHDSVLLAKDALQAGAAGYVVKSDLGLDLLGAIAAVQQGRTFVSRTLGRKGLS